MRLEKIYDYYSVLFFTPKHDQVETASVTPMAIF